MSHNKRKEILTTCPFCGVGCNFYLQVEAERIIGIAPSRNHPVSRGRLCVKASRVLLAENSRGRVAEPAGVEGLRASRASRAHLATGA